LNIEQFIIKNSKNSKKNISEKLRQVFGIVGKPWMSEIFWK
jgi:hypothetical protein